MHELFSPSAQPTLGFYIEIRAVDREEGRVWFDRSDGSSGFIPVGSFESVAVGETYFLPHPMRSGGPILVRREAPRSAGSVVGIVRRVSADGQHAILEVNGNLLSFPQRKTDPFVENQAWAANGDGEFVIHVSDKPIDRFAIGDREGLDPGDLVVPVAEDGVTLDDFGGSEALVRRVRNLAEAALLRDDLRRSVGIGPIKGMLFSGPPGTGKTHLARALSNTLAATFYLIDGPEIINKWVGESEQRLRAIFQHAERHAPSILFFDEIDSIVASRSDDGPEYTSRFIGQFLTMLDGFKPSGRVLVIAATNRPEAMDSALLRPGRLTFKIEFSGCPDQETREKILVASGRGIKGVDGADMSMLAAMTDGWTPADLASIWMEAGILAIMDGRDRLGRADICGGFVIASRNRNVTQRQAVT